MKEIHPELLKRKIVHVDMDAFFAAVEVLDNPALKGLPLVIGGSPNSRSVVCTASYEARKFGIRSAMACSKAWRLCPDAVFIQPRHGRYREISRQIFVIFERYTNKIEPVSLDEAYLDVTEQTGKVSNLATYPDDSESIQPHSFNDLFPVQPQNDDAYDEILEHNESIFQQSSGLQKLGPMIQKSIVEKNSLGCERLDNQLLEKRKLISKLSSATSIARAIKNDIFTEIGLTASAGIAPNKMLAKLASELEKPNGLTVIKPQDVNGFMWRLPVRKINGIGPVGAKKLEDIGIITCADIYKFRKMDLYEKIGPRFAEWLWDHGMGISRSQVSRDHERKSLGSETTFSKDLIDFESLAAELKYLSDDLFQKLKKRHLVSNHLTLKIKYSDFSVQTRSAQLPTPFMDPEQIHHYSCLLLQKGFFKSIRLLGLSLSRLEEQNSNSMKIQMPLIFNP